MRSVETELSPWIIILHNQVNVKVGMSLCIYFSLSPKPSQWVLIHKGILARNTPSASRECSMRVFFTFWKSWWLAKIVCMSSVYNDDILMPLSFNTFSFFWGLHLHPLRFAHSQCLASMCLSCKVVLLLVKHS